MADDIADDILVELIEPDADPERLDATTRALRQELLDLDVESVVPATSGPAPEGSKGLDIAAVGALVVHATAAGDVVVKLVTLLRGWLRRSPARGPQALRLTIGGQSLELTNATEDQQQELVDAFLRSVAAPDATA